VRHVKRDHANINLATTFNWDGRDDFGVDVPEGQYRVLLDDYEFFVTVDRTRPLAAVKLSSAYAKSETNPLLVAVAPVLSWSLSDTNFVSMVLDSGTGAVPASWQEYGRTPDLLPISTRTLMPANMVDKRYRMTVADKAGNTTVVTSELAPQELFLTAYADHRKKAPPHEAAWEDNSTVAYAKPGGVAALMPSRHAPLRLQVFESIRRPLASVLLQYRYNDSCADCWTEVPVTAFVSPKDGNYAVEATPKDHAFELLWDVTTLDLNKALELRIKALDVDGAEFSGLVSYTVAAGRNQNIQITGTEDSRPAMLIVKASAVWDSPVTRIALMLRSSSDPRYAVATAVHTVFNPARDYQHVIGGELMEKLDLRACADYQLTLRAEMASGETFTSVPKALKPRCLDVNVAIGPETAASCDASPSGKTQLLLEPLSLNGRKIAQLLFGEFVDGNRESVLNNWNDVSSGAQYTFLVDTSALPAGMRHYFVHIIDEDGNKETVTVPYALSHEAPTARLTAPAAGAKVCPMPGNDADGPLVRFEVDIASSSAASYGIEIDGKPITPVPCAEADFQDGSCLLAMPVRQVNSTADGAFKKAYLRPGQAPRSGELGRYALDKSSTSATARLRVINGAGYNVCSAPVRFDAYDALVKVTPASLDRAGFSPTVAAPMHQVNLRLSPHEDVTVDVDVFPAQLGEGNAAVPTGPAVRALAKAAVLTTAGTSLAWDGRSDSGVRVSDGLYLVRVRYTDGCGNVLAENLKLDVDGSGPDISIATPERDARLGLLTAVTGAVRDPHFAQRKLEFAMAAAPDKWLPLGASDAATDKDLVSELLGTWNTFGLSGPVTLRLVATDSFGNESKREIPLVIASQGNLVNSFDAAPAVFSPNGDGRNDRLGFKLGMLAPVTATLTIAREDQPGTVVRQYSALPA
jgi:hypothetical protein